MYSTYLANKIQSQIHGATAYVAPATLYIGLSSTPPNADGTNVTEPAAGGYARVAVANNTTQWPAAASRKSANGQTIAFPKATADWLTGTALGYVVVYDAATGGNMLEYGALTTAKSALAGDIIEFTAGELATTLN